jgi:hypothetical protein
MRKTTLIVLLALAAVVLAAAVTPDDHQSLHELMEGLKDNLKGVATNLGTDAQRPAALRHVAQMQGIVLLAKELEPSNMEEVTEGERAAHKLAFRADLARLLGELAVIEQDICEGRNQAAMAAVRGKLFELREAGHEKYQPEGEHDDDDDGDDGHDDDDDDDDDDEHEDDDDH